MSRLNGQESADQSRNRRQLRRERAARRAMKRAGGSIADAFAEPRYPQPGEFDHE
jgi:hypothetical protein